MVVRYNVKTPQDEKKTVEGDTIEKILAPIVIEGSRYIVTKFMIRRYGSDSRYSGDLDFILPEEIIFVINT